MAVVRGVVMDKFTGEPIPGALINIDGFRTTSASDGTFYLEVPEGTHIINVTATNYEPVTRVVEIGDSTYLTILMTPVVRLL